MFIVIQFKLNIDIRANNICVITQIFKVKQVTSLAWFKLSIRVEDKHNTPTRPFEYPGNF